MKFYKNRFFWLGDKLVHEVVYQGFEGTVTVAAPGFREGDPNKDYATWGPDEKFEFLTFFGYLKYKLFVIMKKAGMSR